MTATLTLELAANEGFAANSRRGTGHVFDQGALDRFLHVNQLSHVVRAHELHQSGFMVRCGLNKAGIRYRQNNLSSLILTAQYNILE